MKDKDKIFIADMVLNYISIMAVESDNSLKFVGTLNKRIGIKGFQVAEPGNPVMEQNGKYIILLETLDGKGNCYLPYNKEDLKMAIDFKTELSGIIVPEFSMWVNKPESPIK